MFKIKIKRSYDIKIRYFLKCLNSFKFKELKNVTFIIESNNKYCSDFYYMIINYSNYDNNNDYIIFNISDMFLTFLNIFLNNNIKVNIYTYNRLKKLNKKIVLYTNYNNINKNNVKNKVTIVYLNQYYLTDNKKISIFKKDMMHYLNRIFK